MRLIIYLTVLTQGFKEMMQSRKVNATEAFTYLKEKISLRTYEAVESFRM